MIRGVVTVFRDLPAVEWRLHFKNNGNSDTPLLEDIQALDVPLRSPNGDPVIHYAKGGTASMDDYMPLQRVLSRGGKVPPPDRKNSSSDYSTLWPLLDQEAMLRVEPGGGRSSSEFLPFFNVEVPGSKGAVIGIGWSGEWAATFSFEKGTTLRARAGMASTHLVLHPGEEIGTPLIAVLFWQGERMRGYNLMRQFVLAHHRPTIDGKPANPPISHDSWGSMPAAEQLELIRQLKVHNVPVESYWIDGEWQGEGVWWVNTGNWRANTNVYPAGLGPIGEAVRGVGGEFALWIEPERVTEGTPWARELRQWLLEVPTPKRAFNWPWTSMTNPMWVNWESNRNQFVANDKLLDLGNPEARRFLTDFISAKIQELGLGSVWFDANIAPLEFWRAADPTDRQGMTEIRWVEGLYALWDELRQRHPHLMINNCAAGGRRIDLESLSRSLVLWRTDFAEDDIARQNHTYGLSFWLPLNSTSVGSPTAVPDYSFRSGMSSGVVVKIGQRYKKLGEAEWVRLRKTLEQYQKIRKYYYGDYYPLTEYSPAKDAWMVYQLDLPREGEGLVVALKRPLSRFSRGTFPLRALQDNARYLLTDLDSSEKRMVSGRDLKTTGMELLLVAKPDSRLVAYRKIEK